ncbi:hypothetical protein DESUT3_28180 [Desulfuromonas versatilis]|uniref:GGDEF domain-containing protein n=1 Tax=Desulfuromonas versatilis TaxID=2802975 RepID=A0ABN6E2I6_9BACT|nr:sensor domain-containing diguanylate cyclase [Desulfuromonas versatilis]BCR05749.1 hypothetical protein DESUT3_28180 [Desulfuromonas versatilis]
METPGIAQSLQEMAGVFEELMASLSTLQRLGTMEVHLADEKTLLHQALSALVEHYGVERCSVFLREGERLVNAAGLDWFDWDSGKVPQEKGAAPGQQFEVLSSLMGLAVRTGEAQICRDTRTDPRFRQVETALGMRHLGCVISAPIRSGGDIIGVVNMSHPVPGHFNEWHERMVPLYSSFLGQILIANRLLRRLEEEVGERTRQLEAVLQDTRRLQNHYRNLSMVDELTGLYNRRFFFTESRLALGRAVRYRRPVAFLLIGLDRFEAVHDSFGQPACNMVLRDIAKTLLSQLRESDVLARVGEDEFAVLVSETDLEGSLQLANRLLDAARRQKWVVDGSELLVTLSIGAAAISAAQELGSRVTLDVSELLDNLYAEADRHLNAQKTGGGDGVTGGLLRS